MKKVRRVAKARQVSPAKQVTEEARIDAQQDLITEVQYVLEAVLRNKNISRREIASKLNKSEATISRALDGDSNLTLKTIADIACALGDRFHVSSRHFEVMKAHEKVEPLYTPQVSQMLPRLVWGKLFLADGRLSHCCNFFEGHKAIQRTTGSAFVEQTRRARFDSCTQHVDPSPANEESSQGNAGRTLLIAADGPSV